MTKIHPIIGTGLLALAVGMASAQAQTPEEHAAHHPTAQTDTGTGPMMPMMRQMMAAQAMPEACHHAAVDHIEGRIAYLKAEIAVTDAQLPQWNAFADALRANARTAPDQHRAMMNGDAGGNLPDRLAALETRLTARLEAAKAIAEPTRALYGVLTEQQRQQADELMSSSMGML
jgi:uncharacterized small protein (DUF1192 family)